MNRTSVGCPMEDPGVLPPTCSPHSLKTGILGSIFMPWSVGLAVTRTTRSRRAHRTNVEVPSRAVNHSPVPDPPLKRGLLSVTGLRTDPSKNMDTDQPAL